jgi:ABC-2 type transport system permease protein
VRRLIAIARKEVLHILRDPRSLAVAVLMPVVMVLLFGFAIDMELKNLPIAVLDLDRTPESRGLVRDLTSSGFIRAAARLESREEIEPGFRRGRFRAAVIISEGYGRALARGERAGIQALVDGADGATAATVDNYLGAAISLHDARTLSAGAGLRAASAPPVDPRTRIYFNPDLESAHFIVPGLVAVVLTMICALLTSIALAREKETGTLEQVLTTPVGAGQLIIGKLLPYLVIGLLDAAVVLGLGRLVFDVPMRGSWAVLAGYSLIFVLISLALGLMCSAMAKTQRVAMMLALLTTFLPALLLSGFVFDHASMPGFLRGFSQIIPATHYLRVVHGVMLKGEAWFPVQGGVMLGMLGVLLLLARGSLRTRLD